MRYKVTARYKGTNERFTNVQRGSGDGGGTHFFDTKRDAEHYASQLYSFDTRVEEAPIKHRKAKPRWGFGW